LTCRCLNSNLGYFGGSTIFIFIRLENHGCLSRGVQEIGVVRCAVTRIVSGVRDLLQRTGDSRISRVLGDRTIERSGGTMCDLYRAHEK
jgi:hypothetical protein